MNNEIKTKKIITLTPKFDILCTFYFVFTGGVVELYSTIHFTPIGNKYRRITIL